MVALPKPNAAIERRDILIGFLLSLVLGRSNTSTDVIVLRPATKAHRGQMRLHRILMHRK
jgi:hypothetical protein